MRDFLKILKREDNSYSLARCLTFAFGIEVFALLPIVILWLLFKENPMLKDVWLMDIVFLIIDKAISVYNKSVECKYFTIKDGDKNV